MTFALVPSSLLIQRISPLVRRTRPWSLVMMHWTRSGVVIIMGRARTHEHRRGPGAQRDRIAVLEEITLLRHAAYWQIDQGRLPPGAGIEGTLAGLRRA